MPRLLKQASNLWTVSTRISQHPSIITENSVCEEFPQHLKKDGGRASLSH